MINKVDKNKARLQRAKRTSDIHGTADKPRLTVNRSLTAIYAQLINDDDGKTIVAVNSLQAEVKKATAGKTKSEVAFIVGETLAKLAKAKKITKVVFDRSGYVYTGRVAQVAEGARKGGLQF